MPKNKALSELSKLRDVVKKLHKAKASFIGSVPVDEQFEGVTVWRGVVSQFRLTGHPTAELCYAWRVPADQGDGIERFYAVLHTSEVNSPAAAVRASIVAQHRSK